MATTTIRPNEPGNPPYPALGAQVAKFRKIPRDRLTDAQKQAYSDAIRSAVLSLQRSELQRELPSFKPRCASGTWHTTGEAIHEAVRRQQHAALLAYPDKVRRARTDCEWAEMYEEAMKEKRTSVERIAA